MALPTDSDTAAVSDHFTKGLSELAALASAVARDLGPQLARAHKMVRETVRRRGKLLFCGNGGSAADAQHLATEYVVRYMSAVIEDPALNTTDWLLQEAKRLQTSGERTS